MICEENYPNMYHVALGMTKDPDKAGDAVQEAFLSLWENYEKYTHLHGREMTALCVLIVKNKVIDGMRRGKHNSGVELESLPLYDERPEHDAPRMAEMQEQRAAVRRVLELLPEVYRDTLALKYYYEMGNREIAGIQGVSVKTVEMRLYRGKKKFKEVWNGTKGAQREW